MISLDNKPLDNKRGVGFFFFLIKKIIEISFKDGIREVPSNIESLNEIASF